LAVLLVARPDDRRERDSIRPHLGCICISWSIGIMLPGQVVHDPDRAGDDQEHDQDAEGERQDVVGVVRAGGDVEEEDEVHAHLGDGEDHRATGMAGP
jgi:hypothetical protein